MKKDSRIYVAGHKGLVGSAIHRSLLMQGYRDIITMDHCQLDLLDSNQVNLFFNDERPEYVFLSAAKVGGIYANSIYKADFLYENLMIETNVIHASYQYHTDKLLFLGSSCIYPKMASQPIVESSLLTGSLEPTNESYAIAKIAGIKLCEAYRDQYKCNFISVMPTNLYGIGDNFDLEKAHVLPALIRKFHEAKLKQLPSVNVWGTGTPRREFLFADDLAEACVFLMNTYDGRKLVNIGTGIDLTISDLAMMIKNIVGYEGSIVFDSKKPDGTPQKLLDVSFLQSLGWQYRTNLEDGIRITYEHFKKKY